jgi:hypothetical protein
MLRRLLFAFIAGVIAMALVHGLLCDAPNSTLADPAYCGPREWMTQLSAFLFGAGLVWVFMLRKPRTKQDAAPAPEEPAAPPAPQEDKPAP